MCAGIALALNEFPLELAERRALLRRVHERGGEREVRFFHDDPDPRLPIRREGRLQLARWGNRSGRSDALPRTCWTWSETVRSGGWVGVEAVPVIIPATLCFDGGVWYHVRRGVQGLLAPDERGMAVVYMVCEPASHYYRVMTRSNRMPTLVDERI